MDTVLTTPSFENIKFYSTPDIKRSANYTSITTAIITLIVGILLLLFPIFFEGTNQAIISVLMMIGIALIIFSGFRLIWRSKSVVYLPTKSTIKEEDFYFDSKCYQTLNSVVTTGNHDLVAQLRAQSGGACKLVVLYSKDKQFIALQILKYEPFSYVPQDEVYSFKDKVAEKLIDAIQTAKHHNLRA